ncbi:hypothetical protein RUM44_006088 [Polyplax serrata]|uniref:Uncharacterized protein n=1 Tax=Polyplax serrata TaxID=468196 RepID=A0ABR1AZL9_POLSC
MPLLRKDFRDQEKVDKPSRVAVQRNKWNIRATAKKTMRSRNILHRTFGEAAGADDGAAEQERRKNALLKCKWFERRKRIVYEMHSFKITMENSTDQQETLRYTAIKGLDSMTWTIEKGSSVSLAKFRLDERTDGRKEGSRDDDDGSATGWLNDWVEN